jgi:hypothetical protein
VTLSMALIIFFNIILILCFELNVIRRISKNVTRMWCRVVNHVLWILEYMVKYFVLGICKVICLIIWIIKGIVMVVLTTMYKCICKLFFLMRTYALCMSILCTFILLVTVVGPYFLSYKLI